MVAGLTYSFGIMGFQPCGCPCNFTPVLAEVKPLTGEPDAGDPPVRFGGGRRNTMHRSYPYRFFNQLQTTWTPVFTGVTTFYETVKLGCREFHFGNRCAGGLSSEGSAGRA